MCYHDQLGCWTSCALLSLIHLGCRAGATHCIRTGAQLWPPTQVRELRYNLAHCHNGPDAPIVNLLAILHDAPTIATIALGILRFFFSFERYVETVKNLRATRLRAKVKEARIQLGRLIQQYQSQTRV